MAATILKRVTKRIRNNTPWPAHWIVSNTYEACGKTLESRKWEVALKGAPSTWYLFDRHVTNPELGVEWVDAFALKPFGAFTAFRPEMIVKVRARRVAVAKTVKVDESTAA